jgi:hypothetical protein
MNLETTDVFSSTFLNESLLYASNCHEMEAKTSYLKLHDDKEVLRKFWKDVRACGRSGYT